MNCPTAPTRPPATPELKQTNRRSRGRIPKARIGKWLAFQPLRVTAKIFRRYQWAMRDLNPRLLRCKRSTLAAELIARCRAGGIVTEGDGEVSSSWSVVSSPWSVGGLSAGGLRSERPEESSRDQQARISSALSGRGVTGCPTPRVCEYANPGLNSSAPSGPIPHPPKV